MNKLLALVLAIMVPGGIMAQQETQTATNQTQPVATEPTTVEVTGRVISMRGADGKVVKTVLISKDGPRMTVLLDEEGQKLAKIPSRSTVKVTGTTIKKDTVTTITVQKFEVISTGAPVKPAMTDVKSTETGTKTATTPAPATEEVKTETTPAPTAEAKTEAPAKPEAAQ